MRRSLRSVLVGTGALALAAAGLTVAGPASAGTPGWLDTSYGQAGFQYEPGAIDSAIAADGTVSYLQRNGELDFRLNTVSPAGGLGTNPVVVRKQVEGQEPGLFDVGNDGTYVLVADTGTAEKPGSTVQRIGGSGTFGTGGEVFVPAPSTLSHSRGAVRLADGTVLVATYVSSGTSTTTTWQAVTPDGTLSTTWGDKGSLTLPGVLVDRQVALAGGLYVVGRDAADQNLLVRITPAGAVDTSFGTAGKVSLAAYITTSAPTSWSGTLYIGVDELTENGSRTGVLALTGAGVPSAGFGTGGIAWSPIAGGRDPFRPSERCGQRPASVHVSATSVTLLSTSAFTCEESGADLVARFSATGVPDVTFGSGGVVVLTEIDGNRPYGFGVSAQLADGAIVAEAAVASQGTTVPVLLRLATAGRVVDGGFVPLEPTRLLDTRSGVGASAGKVAPNGEVKLAVAGRGGIPVGGAKAVLLNVTVTGPTAACAITVYPAIEALPTASNLNCRAGETRANAVTVRLLDDGAVRIRNGSNGTTHLVADVVGYYKSGSETWSGAFDPLSPTRLLDTRTGLNAPKARVNAGGSVTLDFSKTGSVGGASAVVLNTTVVNPTGDGYLSLWPGGTAKPNASTLNYAKGQTLANLATVRVGADNTVTLGLTGAGSADLVADVAGYYIAGDSGRPGTFVPVAPTRIVDTRSSGGAVAAAGTRLVPVLGRAGVPAKGVSAVALNLTGTAATGSTNLTVRDAAAFTAVTTSNVNATAGGTVAGFAASSVGASGLGITNSGPGRIQVIADLAGWFRS